MRRQMRGNLDPLRLAARQGGRRLPQSKVAEAAFVQHLQPAQDLWRTAEKGQRFANRQVEDLVNVPALVTNFQHLRLEALAVALIAGHEYVGQELHFDADFASPWQASHRPPGTLKEKWLAVSPRDRASLVAAKSSRIGSNAFR